MPVESKIDELRRKAAAFDALREACGYVENGSDEIVKVFQDDATKDWVVKVGRETRHTRQRTYFGRSMDEAFVNAGTGEKQE